MPTADVWITPVTPAGPTVGFGLTGNATLSQYTSGGTIWNATARPRRKAFLEFGADPLQQLDLPLLLDIADAADANIERQAALVATWIRPTGGTGEPPVLRVAGPIDQGGVTGWVAQTLAWGDQQIRRADGARTQANLVLTLLERTGSPVVSPALSGQLTAVVATLAGSGVPVPSKLTALIQQLPSLLSRANSAGLVSAVTTELAQFISGLPANPAGAAQVVDAALPQLLQLLGTLGGAQTYVVRDGDTLQRIAARELGDYRKADAIAALNGIRDWASIRANDVVYLP